MKTDQNADLAEAKEAQKSYQEYNKSLRTWFVAFGIGGPVLLLTRENLLDKLSSEGVLKTVSMLFLLGAATQVLIAFINKVECWYCYYARVDKDYAKTQWGRLMLWLDNQFIIDVLCDVITIISYLIAVILIFNVYV